MDKFEVNKIVEVKDWEKLDQVSKSEPGDQPVKN